MKARKILNILWRTFFDDALGHVLSADGSLTEPYADYRKPVFPCRGPSHGGEAGQLPCTSSLCLLFEFDAVGVMTERGKHKVHSSSSFLNTVGILFTGI